MKGFTIVELLVSMSIVLLVAAATLGLVGPVHDAFQVQPESADLQQRVRVGIDALQRELLVAGAGMYAAGLTGPLHHAFAPLMPYRAFGDASDSVRGTYFRSDAISLLSVPSTPSQATLASPFAAGSLEIDLDQGATCPPAVVDHVCGFAAGDSLLVFDRHGAWELYTVDGADGVARVRLEGPMPAREVAAGSNVTAIRATSYALRADLASGAYQLVRADALGSAQPVLDHVVKLEFRYFGDSQPPHVVNEDDIEEEDLRASYGPAPPAPDEAVGGWPPGENCTFALIDGRRESRLPSIGAADGLVEIGAALLTDGPWCPDAQARNRFDADLLRIRRVRLTLRVQTALASLRGPVGVLFARGGTARAGSRYVPDLEIQLDVTPRNLNLRPER
jgi:prepilin-type N-terminal cleavage/methylation domain-containing protein